MAFRKDEWTAIACGKFMVIFCATSISHPQIRLVFAPILYCTDDAKAICGAVWMLHVAAGSHQHHRQSHIIIRSLYCRLWGLYALFLILLLSAHWCAAFVLHCWEQLSVKHWIAFWSLNFISESLCPQIRLWLRLYPVWTENLHNVNSLNFGYDEPKFKMSLHVILFIIIIIVIIILASRRLLPDLVPGIAVALSYCSV